MTILSNQWTHNGNHLDRRDTVQINDLGYQRGIGRVLITLDNPTGGLDRSVGNNGITTPFGNHGKTISIQHFQKNVVNFSAGHGSARDHTNGIATLDTRIKHKTLTGNTGDLSNKLPNIGILLIQYPALLRGALYLLLVFLLPYIRGFHFWLMSR